MNKLNGIFVAQDSRGNSIVLEWEEITGKTEVLDEKIKSISSLLIPAYVKQEVEFAYNNANAFTAEDIANDFMIKSLSPLLQQGRDKINVKLLEEKTKSILEGFFASLNWSQYSTAQDVNIFVVAKDRTTKENLGIIQFLIKPEFGQNNIKAALYGVIPLAQDRGLEKILMSSIFKLRPEVKRIFLHTRSTNKQALQVYQEWGFTQFEGKLNHWTDMEYVSDHSDILQEIAAKFVVQS